MVRAPMRCLFPFSCVVLPACPRPTALDGGGVEGPSCTTSKDCKLAAYEGVCRSGLVFDQGGPLGVCRTFCDLNQLNAFQACTAASACPGTSTCRLGGMRVSTQFNSVSFDSCAP